MAVIYGWYGEQFSPRVDLELPCYLIYWFLWIANQLKRSFFPLRHGRMTGLSKLKKFMLCAFIVATVSFLVMFYYSVNFSNYSKLLGLKQEGTSKRGIDRDLRINEQTLFPVNSTAPSNFSDTGASKQQEINMVITQPSLRSTSTEQKLVREDIKVLKNTTNSSNTKPTATGVIEQKKATKPNLAPNSNKESGKNTQELSICTPSSLGKYCVFIHWFFKILWYVCDRYSGSGCTRKN